MTTQQVPVHSINWQSSQVDSSVLSADPATGHRCCHLCKPGVPKSISRAVAPFSPVWEQNPGLLPANQLLSPTVQQAMHCPVWFRACRKEGVIHQLLKPIQVFAALSCPRQSRAEAPTHLLWVTFSLAQYSQQSC